MVFSGSEAWEEVRRLPAQLKALADRLRRKAASVGAADVDTEVAPGASEVAILEMVERRDADLIVRGVAHRSWLDRLAFGSTLRRLLRRVTVPVLVVPVIAGDNPWPDEAGLGKSAAACGLIPWSVSPPDRCDNERLVTWATPSTRQQRGDDTRDGRSLIGGL